MSEHDLETLLRDRLSEHVDTLLGPRREVPPFEPPITDRRRRTWLTPLLAAACVAVVAVGALVAATLLGSGGTQQPAHPTPPAPTSTGTQLDGARVVLPHGWVARRYTRWLPKGEGSEFDYCLSPRSVPVRRGVDTCPVAFTGLGHGFLLDPDIEGGFQADPHPCGQRHEHVEAMANTLPLGGRTSAHRAWSIACAGNNQVHKILQYVVVTKPAYVLFTNHGGRDTGAAMDYIATHSQLPSQDAPLPLFDRGLVTATAPTTSGVRVTLQRVSTPYGTRQVIKDNSGTRYSYVVPHAKWHESHATVGSIVTIYTDGHHVTNLYKQAR